MKLFLEAIGPSSASSDRYAPDPHPDPHQSEKQDLDPDLHQSDADPQYILVLLQENYYCRNHVCVTQFSEGCIFSVDRLCTSHSDQILVYFSLLSAELTSSRTPEIKKLAVESYEEVRKGKVS